MNITTAHTGSVTNVTGYERAFRTALGMGLLVAVIAGALSAPAAMFTAAMVAIYLVMSAIMGIDPVYAATKSLSRGYPTGRGALTTS
jgi:hypothetical protein